eukprot:3732073-Rhodomonas_salina.2
MVVLAQRMVVLASRMVCYWPMRLLCDVRCAVLSKGMVLPGDGVDDRARHQVGYSVAMSGTGIAYAAVVLCDVRY